MIDAWMSWRKSFIFQLSSHNSHSFGNQPTGRKSYEESPNTLRLVSSYLNENILFLARTVRIHLRSILVRGESTQRPKFFDIFKSLLIYFFSFIIFFIQFKYLLYSLIIDLERFYMKIALRVINSLAALQVLSHLLSVT